MNRPGCFLLSMDRESTSARSTPPGGYLGFSKAKRPRNTDSSNFFSTPVKRFRSSRVIAVASTIRAHEPGFLQNQFHKGDAEALPVRPVHEESCFRRRSYSASSLTAAVQFEFG